MKSLKDRELEHYCRKTYLVLVHSLFNLGALTTLQEFTRKKLYQNEVTPICTIHAIFS